MTKQKGRPVPPPAGLGVARDAIQSVFEAPPLEYSFSDAPAVQGQPRVVGDLPSHLGHVELIGPPDNLMRASVMVGMGHDDPATWTAGAYALTTFLQRAVPTWSEGREWLGRNLSEASKQGTVSTRRGPLEITLSTQGGTGIVALTVARKG